MAAEEAEAQNASGAGARWSGGAVVSGGGIAFDGCHMDGGAEWRLRQREENMSHAGRVLRRADSGRAAGSRARASQFRASTM